MTAMWREVTRFEFYRTVRKKSFWFATLIPVVLIVGVLTISYISDNSAKNSTPNVFSNSAKIAALDQSGLLNQQLLKSLQITTEPSQDAGLAAVKSGQLQAFFYYPVNV